MNTRVADAIRAHGTGVTLESCEGCKKAKDMDDLNQIAIDRLEFSVGELIRHATAMRKSRDLWMLTAGALGFLVFLLLLGDLGVFKP